MWTDGKAETAGEWRGDGTARSWREIDRALRVLAKRRCRLDAEEAQLLARAMRLEVWRQLGKASFHEYLEDVLGYSPRAAADRVRVATALEDLPHLVEALATGALHYSAVRELTRVVTRATEAEWIEHVRGKSLRQVEQAVAGRKRGDLPTDPADPELIATPLRFDVRPATRALLRLAQRVLEEERGHRLDDDELIGALCNAVLAPREDHTGRAKHQILVTTCGACGAAWQDAAGQKQPLDRADLARANCDAQRIAPDGRAKQDIPPRVARFVRRRDGGKCAVPWCRATRYLEIHHVVPREQGGGHEPENLTLLCDGHHRAHHDGKLEITGRAPDLVIRQPATHVGEASTHVGARPAAADETERDAELALVTLGFRPREVRTAVHLARAVVATDAPAVELVREALRRVRGT